MINNTDKKISYPSRESVRQEIENLLARKPIQLELPFSKPKPSAEIIEFKPKTWKSWIYPCIKGKTKKQNEVDVREMGLRKIPGSNYYVVDPNMFQDWFLGRIGDLDD